jgi:DNA-binding response OmpR family regulator
MLTALGEIHQKLRGFDAGADDYLPKPFEPMELVARVKALLKRSGAPDPRVAMGNLILDTDNLVVIEGEVRHNLPAKEFELLEKFARSPGRLFTRDQLLDAVWGQGYSGSDRTVDVYINRLRTRFPEDEYGYRIVPVRGVGYRLEVAR